MDEKYTKQNNLNQFRGNQDIFLGDLINSDEFKSIKNKYLKDVFLGINQLLGRCDDSEMGRQIDLCADKVSDYFKIKKDIALKLILSTDHTIPFDMNYIPRVYSDEKYVYLRFNQKTALKDIESVWKKVKEEQKKLGKVSSKSSINPNLAFCIYRQYVLQNRKMMDIFKDYEVCKLDGYNYPPTISDEHTFRKYYKNIIGGLLIR